MSDIKKKKNGLTQHEFENILKYLIEQKTNINK